MTGPDRPSKKQGGSGKPISRFKPGQSGNPAGKPKGRRCRVTELAEKLMADNAQGIVQAVVDAAKAGAGSRAL